MPSNLTPAQTLAQPFTLPNGTVIKNRIAKSAMSEALGTIDNHVTPALATLYRRWAEGGVGLLITGNVMVDRRALVEPNVVALEDESDMTLLKQWAEAGTQLGTQLWMQLSHPGKQVPRGLNAVAVAPSAIPFGKEMAAFFATPRALTDVEIHDIISRFGHSAALAQQAGFTGVQIHGAHGYLVSQFLSGHHNQRTDQWGGSTEKRQRFALEVYKSIREHTGPGFSIGIKLNSADFQKGGMTEQESLAVIQALAESGIDLIEISGGTYEAPAMSGSESLVMKESTRRREAYFLEFADMARQAVTTPLMVTGGFRTAEGMSDAITQGATDLVGLGRALAIEPELPSRLLAGELPRYSVVPIKTGIAPIDRMGLMEVAWYSRQLRRIANGKDAKPNESGLASFLIGMSENGWKIFKTRLRA